MLSMFINFLILISYYSQKRTLSCSNGCVSLVYFIKRWQTFIIITLFSKTFHKGFPQSVFTRGINEKYCYICVFVKLLTIFKAYNLRFLEKLISQIICLFFVYFYNTALVDIIFIDIIFTI